MSYLLLVTIGPVQDFIASARRCRDLWFGSWLLSELSKKVAWKIADMYGRESLIFPNPGPPAAVSPALPGAPSVAKPTPGATVDPLAEASDFCVANRILALVPEINAAGADEIRRAVQERLERVADSAYANVKGNFDGTTAKKQIKDLLEFYWAAAPVGAGEEGYAEARRRVEWLMAERKTTRNFEPVDWGSATPKSSLDGQRESVIPEGVYDAHKGLSEVKLRHQYGVRKSERLCGVGLLKQHGGRGAGGEVFSTSHVAALPLLECMRRKGAARGLSDKDIWCHELRIMQDRGIHQPIMGGIHRAIIGGISRATMTGIYNPIMTGIV